MAAKRFVVSIPAGDRVTQHLPWVTGLGVPAGGSKGGVEWNVVVLDGMTVDLKVSALMHPAEPSNGSKFKRVVIQDIKDSSKFVGSWEPNTDERAQVTEIVFDLNNTFSWFKKKEVQIFTMDVLRRSKISPLPILQPQPSVPRNAPLSMVTSIFRTSAPNLSAHADCCSLAPVATLCDSLDAHLDNWLSKVEEHVPNCADEDVEWLRKLQETVAAVRQQCQRKSEEKKQERLAKEALLALQEKEAQQQEEKHAKAAAASRKAEEDEQLLFAKQMAAEAASTRLKKEAPVATQRLGEQNKEATPDAAASTGAVYVSEDHLPSLPPPALPPMRSRSPPPRCQSIQSECSLAPPQLLTNIGGSSSSGPPSPACEGQPANREQVLPDRLEVQAVDKSTKAHVEHFAQVRTNIASIGKGDVASKAHDTTELKPSINHHLQTESIEPTDIHNIARDHLTEEVSTRAAVHVAAAQTLHAVPEPDSLRISEHCEVNGSSAAEADTVSRRQFAMDTVEATSVSFTLVNDRDLETVLASHERTSPASAQEEHAQTHTDIAHENGDAKEGVSMTEVFAQRPELEHQRRSASSTSATTEHFEMGTPNNANSCSPQNVQATTDIMDAALFVQPQGQLPMKTNTNNHTCDAAFSTTEHVGKDPHVSGHLIEDSHSANQNAPAYLQFEESPEMDELPYNADREEPPTLLPKCEAALSPLIAARKNIKDERQLVESGSKGAIDRELAEGVALVEKHGAKEEPSQFGASPPDLEDQQLVGNELVEPVRYDATSTPPLVPPSASPPSSPRTRCIAPIALLPSSSTITPPLSPHINDSASVTLSDSAHQNTLPMVACRGQTEDGQHGIIEASDNLVAVEQRDGPTTKEQTSAIIDTFLHNQEGAQQEESDIDCTAAKAAFLQVRNRPLPDLHDPDVQMEILLGNEYTEIVPHLFLAGFYKPQKVAYLDGTLETIVPTFSLVVRCSETPSKCVEASDVPLFAFEPREDSEGRVCVGMHCFDFETQNDLLRLKDCCIEIKAKLEQHCNVLVHCQQGVDRSATVVAAFCMAYFDVSTTEARESLKRLRPACIEQVPGYEELLRTNEDRIRRFFDLVQESPPVVASVLVEDMEMEATQQDDTSSKDMTGQAAEAAEQIEEFKECEEYVEYGKTDANDDFHQEFNETEVANRSHSDMEERLAWEARLAALEAEEKEEEEMFDPRNDV